MIIKLNFFHEFEDKGIGLIGRDTLLGGTHLTLDITDKECDITGNTYELKDWIKAVFPTARWDSKCNCWSMSRADNEKVFVENKDFFMSYLNDNYGDPKARLGETPESIQKSSKPQYKGL